MDSEGRAEGGGGGGAGVIGEAGTGALPWAGGLGRRAGWSSARVSRHPCSSAPAGGLPALVLELQPQWVFAGPDTRWPEHSAACRALRVRAPCPALRPRGHPPAGHLPAGVLSAQNDPASCAHHVLHPGPGAQRLHSGAWVGTAPSRAHPGTTVRSGLRTRKQMALVASPRVHLGPHSSQALAFLARAALAGARPSAA